MTQSQPPDPFDTFGNEELCTWRVAPSICRFQTRRPAFARKLSRRSGTGLVARSVYGGYLRVFQEQISPRAARKLVTRYLKTYRDLKEDTGRELMPTNARFLGRNATASASEPRGSISIAAHSNRFAVKPFQCAGNGPRKVLGSSLPVGAT
jgi:hypothetical protein